MYHKRISHQQGFTLLEVVMASTILATVVVIAGLFWFYVRRNYEFSLTSFRLTANADRAVASIQTELRRAQEAMNGAYPLEILDDNQLAFYADTDGDNQIERIRYFVSNSNLMKGVIEPTGNPPQYTSAEKTTIVAEKLDPRYSPLFTYYNGNWPGDTTNNPLLPAQRSLQTRMVKISIPLDIRDSQGIASYSAQTTVQIRNLKDNL